MSRFAYTSSKAACINLCKTLPSYLKRWHLCVDSLAPEFLLSEMAMPLLKLMRSEPSDLLMLGAGKKWKVPMAYSAEERARTEEDVAGSVLWLAGWAGAYVNGNVVVFDGRALTIVNPLPVGRSGCGFRSLFETRCLICAHTIGVLGMECVLVQHLYRTSDGDGDVDVNKSWDVITCHEGVRYIY